MGLEGSLEKGEKAMCSSPAHDKAKMSFLKRTHRLRSSTRQNLLLENLEYLLCNLNNVA